MKGKSIIVHLKRIAVVYKGKPCSVLELSERFQLDIPLIQAPMGGVATPLLAAQICNSGAIGSLGLGASSLKDAKNSIGVLKKATKRPFNVNFFAISGVV